MTIPVFPSIINIKQAFDKIRRGGLNMTQQQAQMVRLLSNVDDRITDQVYLAALTIVDTVPGEAGHPAALMSSDP